MNLPKDFADKMKNLLGNEYEDFINSYKEERSYGLRINTLKISIENFLNINPFHLRNIPWVEEGFYYESQGNPGKHPYHDAGLYYIQEPSAMAVARYLNPQSGEKILDLCAAPGGKSTFIASMLNEKGLILSNEINKGRAEILSENIERMGIKNGIVTNETPQRLASRFDSFFDKVLVDAPCSGEGMFRKNPEAMEEWNIENIEISWKRQIEILNCAKEMLREGGILVYSTCTFSPEEDEQVIERFLNENKEFSIEEVNVWDGFSRGRKEWTLTGMEKIENAIRIWPHKTEGEGHFIAVLRKNSGKPSRKVRYRKSANKDEIKDFLSFQKEYLNKSFDGNFTLWGDNLYITNEEVDLRGLKVLRPGLHLGTLKKNRFEPSHALALALNKEDAKNTINLSATDEKLISFLKGNTLDIESNHGWNLILVDGYSIGWGKTSNSIVKNHYPKGLRWV